MAGEGERADIGMKAFVIGDIHGAYRALLQCFERSGFDKERDRLIVIGDVCDGYPETRRCIDELLTVKRCDLILGNHEVWALDWAERGEAPEIWTSQGGDRTIASYGGGPMPRAHIDFLKSAKLWIERDGQLFIHGGFDPDVPLKDQDAEMLVWDRTLIKRAWDKYLKFDEAGFGGYKDIFIGHTPTGRYDKLKPAHFSNVWDIDTGAGWWGKLTIMDIETKKYWQSDPTPDLYPGIPGRV